MSEAGEAKCEVHAEPSAGACLRCGRFFCGACRGEPPNDDHCAECDRLIGFLPFEARRGRGSLPRRWYTTYLAIVTDPAAALQRFPREGPVGPAFVFAGVSIALHLVGLLLVVLAVQSLRANPMDFAAPRLDVVRGVVLLLVNLTNLGIRMTLALALVLVLGSVCSSQSPRAAVRLVAYATAYLVLATIPVAGLVAFVRGPRFLIGAAVPQGGPVTRGTIGLGLVALWIGIPHLVMTPIQQFFSRLVS